MNSYSPLSDSTALSFFQINSESFQSIQQDAGALLPSSPVQGPTIIVQKNLSPAPQLFYFYLFYYLGTGSDFADYPAYLKAGCWVPVSGYPYLDFVKLY